MANMKKINLDELGQVTGGVTSSPGTWKWATVSGTKNYLAIRNAAGYESSNEIGRLYNGTKIQIRPDVRNGAYVWAYASSINKEGWVNASYVV